MEKLRKVECFCKVLKVLTVVACFAFFAVNTMSTFADFILNSMVETSSLSYPPSGKLQLPTIFLCNYSAYKNTSMHGSVEQYLDNTLDPWTYIIGVWPNNTKKSNKIWKFQSIYTAFSGHCLAIKHIPEVCT